MTEPTQSAADTSMKAPSKQGNLVHMQSTRHQLSEDLVYTINHAIICTLTDFIDPPIVNYTKRNMPRFGKWIGQYSPGLGNWITQNLKNGVSVSGHKMFELHQHDHHGHHDHDHHDHDHHSFHAWAGEVIGDFGAVPLTLAVQYVAPGLMQGIQSVTEPLVGPLFRWSAKKSAHEWAEKQGLSDHDPVVIERARAVYQHEVDHLPHAAIWTIGSVGLNVATQKLLGSKDKAWVTLVGKAGGSLMTLGWVLGFRALLPDTAQKVDRFNSHHVAEPATRFLSRLLGVDDETVTRVIEREHALERDSKPYQKPLSQIESPKSHSVIAAQSPAQAPFRLQS